MRWWCRRTMPKEPVRPPIKCSWRRWKMVQCFLMSSLCKVFFVKVLSILKVIFDMLWHQVWNRKFYKLYMLVLSSNLHVDDSLYVGIFYTVQLVLSFRFLWKKNLFYFYINCTLKIHAKIGYFAGSDTK